MAIELNEQDIAAVGKIQERKNTTLARAKEYYRIQVKKLANPDVSNRHEIILENLTRGDGRSAPKGKKAKSASKRKAAKEVDFDADPKRPEVPLPEMSREVELKPTEQAHVFTANLFGKKHAVIQAEIDHGKGAEDRFGYVGVSERKLNLAKAFAKENGGLPLAIAATVRVKGRLDQGYAVPLEVFEAHMLKSKHALTLSGKARLAYQEVGWAGVKFVELKAEAKAA